MHEVSVLLEHDIASLGIWFSGSRENTVVSQIALGYFHVGYQTTSDSAPYPKRQDTSRFLVLYLAGLNLSLPDITVLDCDLCQSALAPVQTDATLNEVQVNPDPLRLCGTPGSGLTIIIPPSAKAI